MTFLWERDGSPNVHLPPLLLPGKDKPLFSTASPWGRCNFPLDAGEGREMIFITIIIINDVQDLVSTCLYKHQIISPVPALKLPRAVSFLLFSQPCSSRPSPSSQRHGLFWKPTLSA